MVTLEHAYGPGAEPEDRDREAEAALTADTAETRREQARDDRAGDLLLRAAAGAVDATLDAVHRPVPPSVGEWAVERLPALTRLADEVAAWRRVDRLHGPDGPGWDALLRLRSVADRWLREVAR